MAERRAPRRLLLATALACLALTATATATAPPAAAESAAEVRELARRADTDPAALDRLRQVRDIDGAPADLRGALDGAEGEELQRRLDLIQSDLANSGDSRPPAVANPTQEAERILKSDRFQPDKPPRPLRGLIRALGEFLSPVLEPLGRAFDRISDAFEAVVGSTATLIAVALVVITLTTLVTLFLIRRRTRLGGPGAAQPDGVESPESSDPRQLDRQADAAEAAGDLDLAFRLRFRAGLLRLDQSGAIELRQSATTGQLVRAIRSATFPRLARTFDEVAYGGRTPAAEDLQQAKADWPRVLEEARR